MAKTIDFRKRLKGTKKVWDAGRAEQETLPNGIYTMQLQKCELRESKSGNLMILREHLVVEGEFDGEVATDFLHLETERGPYFVARFLEKVGFEAPDDPEEIADMVEQLNTDNPIYTAEVKTKEGSDFTNINIQRMLEGSADVDTNEEPDSGDETDELLGAVVTVDFGNGPEEGTVIDVDGDELNVKFDDGEYQVQRADATVVECEEAESVEEEPDASLEGDVIFHTEDGCTYTVTAHEGDDVTVEDEDGNEYECTLDEFNLDYLAEGEGEEEDLEDLVALAEAFSFEKEIKGITTRDGCRKAFEAINWDEQAGDLTPDEKKTLKSIDITVKRTRTKK